MTSTITEIPAAIRRAATELELPLQQVLAAVRLLDEGNTIPFISRYRKEVTQGLDEEQLRQIERRVGYHRALDIRKDEVLKSIEEQGKLTPELQGKVQGATTLQAVEDLYLPYRPKRRTRAMIAREKGLQPLADLILAQSTGGNPEALAIPYLSAEHGLEKLDDVLAGACDIVAEVVAEDAEVRRVVRDMAAQQSTCVAVVAEGAADPQRKYEMYYDYKEPITRMAPHRLLAINRAVKEGVLKYHLDIPMENTLRLIGQRYPANPRSALAPQLENAIADGAKRLLLPAIETDVHNGLTEQAEAHAIKIFAANLRQLLLQPPIRDKVVLALDPGFRTGCKVAVIDATGKPLFWTVIYPHPPQKQWNAALDALGRMIEKFQVDVIAIGNGTASRETEQLAADVIVANKSARPTLAYVMVSEAGASVYSASELARAEFPDLDVTERGGISIGRRLQDPLAELVKIDPKAIGVGLYQHDVNQKELAGALDGVVESCVNYVGVDLNTASAALLNYVSGINKRVAENVVVYRNEHGKFRSRKELMKVKGLGEATFTQAAGFLKIPDGTNLLDNTFIHPESYEACKKLFTLLGTTPGAADMAEKIAGLRAEFKKQGLGEVATMLGIGLPTLTDMLANLEKPGRDPREELPKPILRSDILKMEDLAAGMTLQGTVRNVVDFGAFVDIGVKQDGLVHISEMSARRIKHPLDAVSVGDVINVRVLSIDKERGRIALSMREI